jgi:hypothetical protein
MLLFRYFPVLLLSALAACSDGPAGRPATPAGARAAPDTAAVRQAARQYRVQYNSPVDLDSTDFYYQPVSVVPLAGGRGSSILKSSSYDSDASGSKDWGGGTCYNLLFFRKTTSEERMLLPHSRFDIIEIDDAKKPDARWPYLFYTILKADTNADGRQDQDDASALFVSDRSGQRLRQLTPDGTRLESRQLLPKTSLLLVEVRTDSNRDRKFSNADASYWLRFDLRDLRVPAVRQPAAALAETLHRQMLDRQSQQLQ